MTGFWTICADVKICQIQNINGFCDLENDVKVKLLIYYEVFAKEKHLAF